MHNCTVLRFLLSQQKRNTRSLVSKNFFPTMAGNNINEDEMYDIIQKAKEEDKGQLILNWINSNGAFDLSEGLDDLEAKTDINIKSFGTIKEIEGTNFLAVIGIIFLVLVIGMFLLLLLLLLFCLCQILISVFFFQGSYV